MTTFERRQYGRNHAYYLDGAKVPGVTTILSTGLPAPALVAWAANTTAAYAVNTWDILAALPLTERFERLKGARFEVLGAASLKGTQVHELAQGLIHGADVDVPDEHVGPVEALARLMDTLDMKPVLVEAPVVHVDHRWGGTIDATATIDGQLWLLDYKTGKGMYPNHALQVTAYAHATHYQTGAGQLEPWTPPDRVGLIHVTSDSATLHEVDASDEQYTAFRHVQTVARWVDRCEQARRDGEPWPIMDAS